jgi:hypothetical protein
MFRRLSTVEVVTVGHCGRTAAWLAFSATTLLQHNAFELKPPRLTVINSAYQLTLFIAMTLAIGLST